MLPQSVKTRHRAMHDFDSCYEQLCCLQATIPLQFVKAHLKERVLDVNGDRIRMIDWAPILDSIKINKSLRYIAIRSFFQGSNSGSGKKSHYFKRKTPSICLKDVTQWIATSLRSCLTISMAIKCLDLQGVPLRVKDVALLSKGIEKNVSLSYVSLNYCQISDKGVQAFCLAVRNHPCITHISLSGCNITPYGTAEIAKMITHQSTLRHSEAWAESLRYRTPNFNCMGGIRRITLNSNPMIGDAGISAFTEALKDDLWLKALDFQQCGVSTEGAMALLATMQYNNTLVVLDLRQNPMIDSTTLRTLLGRVLMNANENDEADYPWIKEEAPKDPYCTKKYRPPKAANRSFGKKASGKSNQRKQSDGAQGRYKLTAKYRSPVAWQKAVKESQENNFFDDEKTDDESVVLHVDPKKLFESISGSPKSISEDLYESVLVNENHLTLNESHAFIKHLKIDVLITQRKLEAALESEKMLNAKVMSLEVENARLKKELATAFENSRLKTQIDDETVLESIEQSFNKFHNFLDRLRDAGLGSLASVADLDRDFFLSSETKTSFGDTTPRIEKTVENDEHLPVDKPIIIQATGKTKEQVDLAKAKNEISSKNADSQNCEVTRVANGEKNEEDQPNTEKENSHAVSGSSTDTF